MTVGESAQRTTLRHYAKPKIEQTAAIVMYDPVRKILREYFSGGRDVAVLSRVRDVLKRQPIETKFDAASTRSNLRALANLENLQLRGDLADIERYSSSTVVAGLEVRATVDFLANFRPAAIRTRRRRVAVIVNPSGVRRGKPEARTRFARIECEFALRMLGADRADVDECWYIDLPKEAVVERYARVSSRLWADIDAACERMVEDFKRYRLGRERPEEA